MCDRLADLEDAMRRYAVGFDAALVTGEQAAVVVAGAVAIERMAATVKGLAAARPPTPGRGRWPASARPPMVWPGPPGYRWGGPRRRSPRLGVWRSSRTLATRPGPGSCRKR